MSAVSSASSSNSLYSFLQNLSTTQAGQPTSALTALAGATASTVSTTTGGVSALGHHHGHGKKGESQLFQQIQQAVTSALQSAQQGGTTDFNKTVEDAIANVLKTSSSSPLKPAGDGDGDADASASANTPASASSASGQQTFLQTLQSFGIDPKQFRQDFLAAVQDAQNATGSNASITQALQPGSLFDTIG